MVSLSSDARSFSEWSSDVRAVKQGLASACPPDRRAAALSSGTVESRLSRAPELAIGVHCLFLLLHHFWSGIASGVAEWALGLSRMRLTCSQASLSALPHGLKVSVLLTLSRTITRPFSSTGKLTFRISSHLHCKKKSSVHALLSAMMDVFDSHPCTMHAMRPRMTMRLNNSREHKNGNGPTLLTDASQKCFVTENRWQGIPIRRLDQCSRDHPRSIWSQAAHTT